MRRSDEYYMKMALALAVKAKGLTSPNPMVGAVVVKRGRVVGEGYHKRAGSDHAEVIALKKSAGRAAGATLYVNLEPCAHYGKTPPCVDRVINSGIKRVVTGMIDPNPLTRGKGSLILRRAGIDVKNGVLPEESKRLNEAFITYITEKRPFVTVKAAESIDGKIATRKGDSRWISSEKSRRMVHAMRSEADAVMVGVNTVVADDPLLTSRMNGSARRQPLRIIVDARLSAPLSSKVFSKKLAGNTIVATTRYASRNKMNALEKKGVELLTFNGSGRRVDLKKLLKALSARGVINLLVEGGGTLISSLLNEGLVDKVLFFIAPKIIGGSSAVTAVEGAGAAKVKDAIKIESISVERAGEDILLSGYVRR